VGREKQVNSGEKVIKIAYQARLLKKGGEKVETLLTPGLYSSHRDNFLRSFLRKKKWSGEIARFSSVLIPGRDKGGSEFNITTHLKETTSREGKSLPSSRKERSH